MNVTPIASSVSSTPAQFNAASLRNGTPAAQRAAVAAQFEAIMIRQLLGKTMNSMLGGSEGGVSGSVYGDMLTDSISQQLSAGQGLGLGRFIEQQLSPRGERLLSPADEPAASPARPSPVQPSAPLSS